MNTNPALEILCGTPEVITSPLMPFADRTVDFLSDLSADLLAKPQIRQYPDAVTFAFFIRKGNLKKLAQPYTGEKRLGLGVAFHIAPGNVAMNFAYSMIAALLAGNSSIVKAPSRAFPQVTLVTDAIRSLLEGKYENFSGRICVLRYPRENTELTEHFSGMCDVRLIWGGDETIRRVRLAPVPPAAFDITFPDRYSLLLQDAEHIAHASDEELSALAKGFYNDTFLTDQNACTSPRLVYWLGDQSAAEPARERFWNAIHHEASQRYPITVVGAVDKLTAACRTAIAVPGSAVHTVLDNLIYRIDIPAWCPEAEECRCPGGFFLELCSNSLEQLAGIVTRKTQTLTYAGISPEVLREFVITHGLRGVDRIVPVGHSMDFSLVWDGRDLIRSMSRIVDCM